ncbi:MAG: cytochrome c [Deinococcaceae bacterium]
MNRFAVSITLFLIVFGFGAYAAYRSAINTYTTHTQEEKKLEEEAEAKAKEQAQTSKTTTPAPTEAPVEGQAEKGKEIYASNCQGCHAPDGAGGVGPKLAKSEVATWTLAQFEEAVLKGKTPTRELGATMPRFASGFSGGNAPSDQELADLHAYLKSL